MSVYNYVTTVQPSTAVQFAVKAQFINTRQTNLIVSKGTRIEIYKTDTHTLTPILQFELFGRVEALQACQLTTRSTSSLFVLSDRQRFCILSYDTTTRSIVSDADGTLEQKSARPSDDIIAATDPQNRLLAVSAYTGLLLVVPIIGRASYASSAKGKGKAFDHTKSVVSFQPFSVRISEFTIRSIVALHGTDRPSVAILYENQHQMLAIKPYEFNLPDRDIVNRSDRVTGYPVDGSVHLLIAVPMPRGGVLAFGEESVSYYDLKGNRIVKDTEWIMATSGDFVDPRGTQCAVADTAGFLYLVQLEGIDTTVTGITVERLGSTSTASTLVHLCKDMLYLGSLQGDSQLLQLVTSSVGSRTVEVLNDFPNLGPITDFCVFDPDKQGRQTMVCCSGAEKDGTLRLVQSGIGFIETAALQVPNIKRLWSLPAHIKSSTHNTLVISTLHSTRVIHHPGGDTMEEPDSFSAFCLDQPTLATGLISTEGLLVQVTARSVRLMSKDPGGKLHSEWIPPNNEPITVAAVNACQCVVSSGLKSLYYLEYSMGKLVEKGTTLLDHEVACIDVSPEEEDPTRPAQIAVVGLWGGANLCTLRLPSLDLISQETLPSRLVPRCVLASTLDDVRYVFATLVDGQMVHYSLDASGKLHNPKQIMLGTHAVSLYPFYSDGKKFIFAASDRPTIISSQGQRLLYSAVNLKYVTAFAPFNCPLTQHCLVMVTEDTLLFGYPDPIRKLHFSKLPLGQENGRRILYHETSQTLAVGVIRVRDNHNSDEEHETGCLRIFDARTFKSLGEHSLSENEVVESMSTAKLENIVEGSDSLFMFVGTSISVIEDPERNVGRLLMFEVSRQGDYQLVGSVDLPGVVYSIKPFQGSIVASVNGSIYYLESYRADAPPGERLQLALKLESNVLALCLDTHEDHVLVGDLMQSMCLLKSDAGKKIRKIAVDDNPNWMTAVKILQDDIFVGAESSYNLFTLRHLPDAEDKVTRLEILGEYHLGDMVNCFHNGILSNDFREAGDALPIANSVLFGTVTGAIGVIAGITEEQYEALIDVQENMTRVIPAMGGLNHRQWRMFNNGNRTAEAHHFIDGNLIESFLRLPYEQKQQIVQGAQGGVPLECSVDDLQLIIENLSRIH